MKQSFTKQERLKSKILIGKLFEQGRNRKQFPIKLVYLPLESSEKKSTQAAFSVPKRSFKLAVDRNYLKRLMREAYRKNKHLLPQEKAYAFMFIYMGNKKTDLITVEKSLKKILLTFSEQDKTE